MEGTQPPNGRRDQGTANGWANSADRAARLTALLVFVAGILLVVVPSIKHHQAIFGDPFRPRLQRTVVTKKTSQALPAKFRRGPKHTKRFLNTTWAKTTTTSE